MLAPDELATAGPPERKRATAVRWAALVVVVLVTAAVAVTVVDRRSHQSAQRLQVVQLKPAAPSVSSGSADLVVESSAFTSLGSRAPVPTDVAALVGAIPGVASVHGVVRGFSRLGATRTDPMSSSPWNGRLLPTVVVSWDAGYFQLTAGRSPVATGEVAVDAQVEQMLGVHVGDDIQSESYAGRPLRVVGVFALRGGADLPRVTLLAAPLADAQAIAGVQGFTRLDVTVAKGQDPELVRVAIASRLAGGYSAVGVSRLGTLQQLQDELTIQRAYFDLLSPDAAIRTATVQGGTNDAHNQALYERYAQAASEATLRVQRIAFLDAEHAQLVYSVYWMSAPSSIIAGPQAGAAVRIGGVWKIAGATWCNLANLLGSPCTAQGGVPPPPVSPPSGWDPPSSQPGAVAAFRTMSDPTATLAQRGAAAVDGEAERQLIAAGLSQDALHAGHVQFWISGVRSRGADQVEVLYSLTVTDASRLDTPYPLIGLAVRVDGGWRANGSFACGLTALAGQGCGVPNSPGSGTP